MDTTAKFWQSPRLRACYRHATKGYSRWQTKVASGAEADLTCAGSNGLHDEDTGQSDSAPPSA
jgi:hypothetical protein